MSIKTDDRKIIMNPINFICGKINKIIDEKKKPKKIGRAHV